MKNQLLAILLLLFSTQLYTQQMVLEWPGNEADVLSFVEGGLQRFAIEGHTASIADRITFKIRGMDALTLNQGGSIGIGTLIPHPSALLELSSANGGLLIPRMTSTQRGSIVNPALGLMVFDTDTESIWIRKTSGWHQLSSGGGGAISSLLLDGDGDTKVDVEETADEDVIRMQLGGVESMYLARDQGSSWTRIAFPNNQQNIVIGQNALTQLGTGENAGNIVIGDYVMQNSMSGFYNVAIGGFAMNNNTSGYQNVALGNGAMRNNSEGYHNVAVGAAALFINSTGYRNSAIGYQALFKNSTGYGNTALGWEALKNSTASGNTAVGNSAMTLNTFGNNNTAVGDSTLAANTTGSLNTSMGSHSMKDNTSGYNNTAVGSHAMLRNTTGANNTALGRDALLNNNGNDNTALGYSSLSLNTNGTENVAVGVSSLYNNTTGFYNTAVGYWSLLENTEGNKNVAIGRYALRKNETGISNTAIGVEALTNGVSGNFNTAIGNSALALNNSTSNTGVGAFAGSQSSGQFNVFLGYAAGEESTGNSNVMIGPSAGSNEINSNRLHIGNNATESLIYGEFDNELLKVNGALNVSNNILALDDIQGNNLKSVNSITGNNMTLGGFVVDQFDPEQAVKITVPVNPATAEGKGIRIKMNSNLNTDLSKFIIFENNTGVKGRIQGQGVLPSVGRAIINDFVGTYNFITGDNVESMVSDDRDQAPLVSANQSQMLAVMQTEYAQGLVFMTVDFIDAIITFASSFASFFDPEDVVWAGIHLLVKGIELSLYIANEDTEAGVSYESGGADYAEWLPKAFTEETYMPGDVVGVSGGVISKKFLNSDKFMVISHNPLVIGNMPKENELEDYQQVAFIGQVKVKALGEVKKGEYMLPSGNGDGFAIGVEKSEMKAKDYGRIIGIAWSDSEPHKTINMINTAVGINSNDMANIIDHMQFVINKMQRVLKQVYPGYEMNLFDIHNDSWENSKIKEVTTSKTLTNIVGNQFGYPDAISTDIMEQREATFAQVKNSLVDQGFDFYLFPYLEDFLDYPTIEKAELVKEYYKNVLFRFQSLVNGSD